MLDRPVQRQDFATDTEGALVIRRPLPGSGGIEIESRRLIGVGAALQGQDIARVPGLVRRLLPVCGWAQGVACRRAIEAATGAAADAETESAREVLLLSEAALAHIWRISIDWPALQGKSPTPAPVRDARIRLNRIVAALWSDKDPLEPCSAAGPKARARSELNGLADLIEHCLATVPSDPASTVDWMQTSSHPLALLLLRARDLLPGSDAPAGALPSLTEIAEPLVLEAGFEAAPHRNGEPAELGGLHALPDDAGNVRLALGPLAARFAAMIYAMRQIAMRLRHPDPGTGIPPSLLLEGGWGAGQAETARGALVHAVWVEYGRIAGFRSVAPTEWLLHPRGALAGCLDALAHTASDADLRLATAAFDPCAPVAIMPGKPPDA